MSSPPTSPLSWRRPNSGPSRVFASSMPPFKGKPPWVWIPPEEPGFIAVPDESKPAIIDKAELDIVSYNILSLELTKGDYYRNLDGTVKIDDHDKRVWMLNKRLEKWMVEGKVILLQEVTYSFIMKYDSKRGHNLNKHLHDLMSRHGYECYYNFYNYVPAREMSGKIVPGNGTCTLGLATLVPTRQLRVVQSKLLRPWVHSEYMAEDLKTLDAITVEIERLEQEELSHALLTKLETLQAEKETVHYKYRYNMPTYADRTVIMLALESRANPRQRVVIGNIHMPCQYRDPRIMVRIAVKTKKSILDWMEGASLDQCPMVLGGDFNSDPNEGSGAYRCFNGALELGDTLIEEHKYVSENEFKACVTDEKWTDLVADHAQGVCTNYGFTKRNYEESLRKFKDFMEGLAYSASVLAEPILQLHSIEAILRSADNSTLAITDRNKLSEIVHRARKERGQFFKPRVLVLDHFFLRDRGCLLEKVVSRRTFIYEIIGRTKGHPIPDLHSVKEPSDHLPIFLTLRWKPSSDSSSP